MFWSIKQNSSVSHYTIKLIYKNESIFTLGISLIVKPSLKTMEKIQKHWLATYIPAIKHLVKHDHMINPSVHPIPRMLRALSY